MVRKFKNNAPNLVYWLSGYSRAQGFPSASLPCKRSFLKERSSVNGHTWQVPMSRLSTALTSVGIELEVNHMRSG